MHVLHRNVIAVPQRALFELMLTVFCRVGRRYFTTSAAISKRIRVTKQGQSRSGNKMTEPHSGEGEDTTHLFTHKQLVNDLFCVHSVPKLHLYNSLTRKKVHISQNY